MHEGTQPRRGCADTRLMTNKTTLSLTLLLSMSSACGLIKVNGKPLGGGGSSGSTPSSDASSSPSSSSSAHPDDETGDEWRARQKREYAEQEKAEAAEKAGQPEMCSTYAISNSSAINLDNFADIDNPKHDWKNDARDFAEVMCSTRGAHLELRPKAMALRTKYMKLHGLDENDFLVVLVESMGRGWPGQDYKQFPGPISQIEYASIDALDQLGSKTSMLARVGFVDRCLQVASDKGLLQTILCTSEPIDAAKALAEIEATPDVNIQTRFHLRQKVRDTVIAQTAERAELAKKAKDDPGIAKLIAIADAQRKDWAAPGATRTKLIQLVETMEAATAAKKRSAFAGCEATTRAAWAEIVKAAELPAVNEKDVVWTMQAAVFKSPEAYLAYRAVELCADGSDAAFPSRVTGMSSAYLRRGPRSSTVAAWMAAAGDVKFDSKELEMSRLLIKVAGYGGSWGGTVKVGVIDKVTEKGNEARVSFKKDIVEFEDCIKMKSTGRISRIESNGAISYEQTCLATGMVKYDRTPDDVMISGFLGHDLKSGMLLMVTEDGFPIVATAGSKSKKASWLFGVSLGK
jgi:hypothetical protein